MNPRSASSNRRIPIRAELQSSLIVAGLSHLEARPHHALTLRDLAKAVGVSHTTAAAQFGSMPGYLAALAIASCKALVAKLEAAPCEIVALAQAYVEFAIDHPHAFRLIHDPALWSSASAASVAPGVGRSVSEARKQCDDLFVRAVRQGQKEGTIRAGNASAVARMPAALAYGLATAFVDGGWSQTDQSPVSRSLRLEQAGETLYVAMLGLVA